MASSKEVFELRKNGSIMEAYKMAKQLIEQDSNDEWNVKAFGWCLYDLVKHSVSQKDYKLAKFYADKFDLIDVDEYDDILFESIERAKNLANPEKQIIFEAKEKSKQGNHNKALELYREAVLKFPDDNDLHEQFAWELYKEGKIIFSKDKIDIVAAKKLLTEYIKLKNERPSRIHTLFLRLSDKIFNSEELNFVAYIKLWDLNNLRSEDYDPFVYEGKSYASIAEKVIKHFAKLILNSNNKDEVEYIIPFLDIGIEKFQDNIWLTYYKAKLLHLINRNEEAIQFLIPVIKAKINEYWTWSLLGELVEENYFAISCYSKSLLCKSEDKFLSNVRINLAKHLMTQNLLQEAKTEIIQVIRTKESEGANLTEKIFQFQNLNWFQTTTAKPDNIDFYKKNQSLAEQFLFKSLPWLNACIGESYSLPDNPKKIKRKLFVQLPDEIIEVVESDNRFDFSKNFHKGDKIKVKGEYLKDNFFKLYLLEKQNENEKWSFFSWFDGNVSQVIKNDSGKVSAYRISVEDNGNMKEGIIDSDNINDKLNLRIGQPISAKYYEKIEKKSSILFFRIEKEIRIKILTIKERRNGSYYDKFPKYIGVIDHINYKKRVAHVIVSRQIDSIIKIDKLNEELKIGVCVEVQLNKVIKDSRSYYVTLTCKLSDKEPEEKIIRNFNGIIEINGSFGFADDVYIDSNLIDENMIIDNSIISGKAILNYNKRRGNWGWKAIEIIKT